jgi:hypothetical protein
VSRQVRLRGCGFGGNLAVNGSRSFSTPASAVDEKMEEDQLVEKARMGFDSMVD